MAEKQPRRKMIELRGQRTQTHVASDLGITQGAYAMIELGQRFPRRALQEKMARYFGTTVDELFFTNNDHKV